MPEFKRIKQRTTYLQRVLDKVAEVEPYEFVLTTDSNELYFKNQSGDFIRVGDNKVYKTMADLSNDITVVVGDIVELQGYYEAGDGAHHKRKIEVTDDGSGVQLANGLWANRVKNTEIYNNYDFYNFNNSKGFIAHRGLSAFAPENTLPAYQLAYDNGIYIWETDIDVTSDGEWVLMHDPTVDRTTNGTGTVSSLTLSQIKNLNIDGGANATTIYTDTKVPTFREWLILAKRLNCKPFPEIKPINPSDEYIKNMIKIIIEEGMETSVAVCSFSSTALEKVRKFNKKIQLWWIPWDLNDSAINWCLRQQNAHLYPDYRIVTKEKVLKCNSKGVDVATWTVNTNDIASEMFSFGVRYVATDFLSEVV